MKLKDQGFEAGDEVVVFYDAIKHRFDTIVSANNEEKWGPVILSKASECEGTYTPKGEKYVAHGQVLFHREAVTFDKYGRLTALGHDYVKPRAPKIMTKEASEFQPFEKVVVRNRMVDSWKCGLYSHYDADWGKNLISLGIVDTEGDEGMGSHRCVGGIGYRYCIPFAGNEHLVGKVTE